MGGTSNRSTVHGRSLNKIFFLCGIALCLLGCAYPVRNEPAKHIDDRGYRWSNLKDGQLRDTLVIVTASGGGTRAAALELSVLKGLADIKLAEGGTLADEIDIVSSVSGGSVTAAYFALHGASGFANLEKNFIRKNGISAILQAGLNPIGLAKLSTPSTERIDLLIDYLNRTLFTDHETYGTLATAARRPYLILNAADMVEGTPFALTQENFDLLCSDMTSLSLSAAVAASAAFPVLLSPMTLKNYSPCDARPNVWPPRWAQENSNTSWYDNPERALRGRAQVAYAMGPPKAYIHLLDGGIADNLGVAEPLRILTTNSPAPGYLDSIAQGSIKKIVVIMINARSFATSDLDRSPQTPGELAMLGSTISSGIDQTAAGSASRFRAALSTEFSAQAADLRPDFPDMAANLERIKSNVHLLEIDFDAIKDGQCRRSFHNIGTSWTNTEKEIDALMLVGRALLSASPSFGGVLNAVHGSSSDSTELKTACDRLAN